MKKFIQIITLFFITIIISSCGTTYLVTDTQHDIYINGVYKGEEKVEITRNGFLKKLNIEIHNGANIISETTIKRKFTLKTGVFTYLLNIFGFFTTWQFDNNYYFEGQKKKSEENIWEKDPEKNNIWE